MKKYLSCIVLFMVLVTVAYAASGDKLFKSPGDLVINAGSYVKILTELRLGQTPSNLTGSQKFPGFVPVGGMLAIMPTTSTRAWQPDSGCAIKDGFVRAGLNSGTPCVVPACADCGIPAGTTLPNMVGKFIRGNTTSNTAAGGNVILAVANIPQITSAVTASGQESSGHTHTTSHSHPSNITNGNSQDHTHSASHGHGGSSSDDSVTHTHPITAGGISAHGSHEHYFTNGSGESHTTGYGGNTGPVATFRFAPAKVNQNNYWDDQFVMRNGGAHGHGNAGSDAAGGHAHDAGALASGNSPTNPWSANHDHGSITTSGSYLDYSTTDHSHNVAFSFGQVTPSAIDTSPTNITVVWVIRVR